MNNRPETEHVLKLGWGDIFLWGTASLLVIGLCVGSVLALEGLKFRSDPRGVPETAVFLDFADAPVSPSTELLDLPAGEPAVQSQAVPEPQSEPEPEAVPEPDVQPEVVQEQAVADVAEDDAVEPAPTVPVPVSMPADLARLRETTPATDFTPRRSAPPSSASQAAAPPPARVAAAAPAAPQTDAGTRPNASDVRSWQAQVMRHLAQRRQYPPGASQRREQGVVAVRFSLGPAGQVLSAALAQSSGYAELDEAAVALVYRSSPLPPPPAGLPAMLMTLTAPIEYSVRR